MIHSKAIDVTYEKGSNAQGSFQNAWSFKDDVHLNQQI